MKKKIKDLTFEECQRICDKRITCLNCPIRYSSNSCRLMVLREMQYEPKDELEREVEIDESKN